MRSLAKKPHFWPSQRLKKVLFTAQGCARLRTGPIIMQIPRGYQKKKFIVYKVCDFVDKVGISVLRGVGWVPQKSASFGATAPAQKHPRSRCGTKKHSIWHYFIEFGDTKKCCTFSGLELAPKSRKKLIGALSCMHKGPKCIQSLWDHPKKIPFVQKHKEGAICAILREKTPFLAFPEAKKGVVHCARLRKAAHWPNNNANPSGLSEEKVYCVEKRDMCDP